MFDQLGVTKAEAAKRIIVLEAGLEWAGGPTSQGRAEAKGLLRMQDLLYRGVLDKEEKFEGKDCHETAYICYSSGTVS